MRQRVTRLAALLAVVSVLALPGAALAHPGHTGAEPVPTTTQQDDGGDTTSPLVIAVVVVSVVALAGALYAVKRVQKS